MKNVLFVIIFIVSIRKYEMKLKCFGNSFLCGLILKYVNIQIFFYRYLYIGTYLTTVSREIF